MLIGLGMWQVRRLAWKQDLLARVAASETAPASGLPAALGAVARGQDVDYMRVVTDCPGLDQAPYLKLYALQGAVAGFRAISACAVTEGPYRTILVDRGFVADADASRMPAPGGAAGEHRAVVGLLRAPGQASFVAPDNRAGENAWFRRDPQAMAAALGVQDPAPVFLMLESPRSEASFGPTPAPLPREISNRHLGYAITWFGLAAALAGVILTMVLRKGPQP